MALKELDTLRGRIEATYTPKSSETMGLAKRQKELADAMNAFVRVALTYDWHGIIPFAPGRLNYSPHLPEDVHRILWAHADYNRDEVSYYMHVKDKKSYDGSEIAFRVRRNDTSPFAVVMRDVGSKIIIDVEGDRTDTTRLPEDTNKIISEATKRLTDYLTVEDRHEKGLHHLKMSQQLLTFAIQKMQLQLSPSHTVR